MRRLGSERGVSIDLQDTVSVVVGASEGIGAAIAAGLARAGSRIVAAGRDPKRMESTVAAIEAAGGAIDTETVDVRSPDSVTAFGRAVIEKRGAPTILVNSMGGTLIRPLREVKVEEWDDIHQTHLRGAVLTCQAFVDAMAEKGYGKIINLSSLSAYRGNPLRGAYAVAKAGLNRLTTVMATEWGPLGIRVNGIAPATTHTPRVTRQLGIDSDREAALSKLNPLGRIARPDDMVGPALFLASTLSDYVNGQMLVVDGGLMAVAR
jgi:NAD(P)-dependent dehydrogenase (short-subunit alcohol dehydrogenase family)